MKESTENDGSDTEMMLIKTDDGQASGSDVNMSEDETSEEWIFD